MGSAYLRKYGRAVIDNGYEIVFIKPGTKRPKEPEWTKIDFNRRYKKALANGKGSWGIGIKTEHTPLVDIDCYDKKIVRKMIEKATELCGEGLARIGQDPKTGLLYRTDEPFRKVTSRTYLDEEGRRVKLEVLGKGQQFVSHAIHPDTGQSYRWPSKDHPGNVAADDLNLIDRDAAEELADYFDELAEEKGWQIATKGRESLDDRDYDPDDPFIDAKETVGFSIEEQRARLMTIPGNTDYDLWTDIGMALYHENNGSQDGLYLWHEWSADAYNYDSDALDAKWPSFKIEGKRREPLTFRYIMKLAKKEEERLAGEALDEIKASLRDSKTLEDINEVCETIKKTQFTELLRKSLVPVIKDRAKAVAGMNLTPTEVKAMIKYRDPSMKIMPKWCEPFVYLQLDEEFYNTVTRARLSHKAFDASFGRFTMTREERLQGKASPEHPASHLALHRYEVPVVHTVMYLPGQGEFFDVDGNNYVNSYSEHTIPEIPDEFSEKHLRVIKVVEDHLEHLFESERDRKLLLSFMAYIVQTGERVNWAPIIQGAEGDGKTYFHLLMGAVLGGANVKTVPGEALAEKNTAWAEGSMFCLIEEVRLHGKDRYAIVNKVKPYITNVIISIRRMQVDWYDVINTQSYILTTNHKDGMPSKDSDRYFPMFSNWQTAEALRKFKADNPKYYKRLHDALKYRGALRKWLMEYELHPDFDPKERATKSASRAEMDYLNKTDEEEVLDAILDSGKSPMLTRTLLDSAMLSDAMLDEGQAAPYGRGMKMMLSEAGFTFLKQVKIDGKPRKLWSQEPRRFKKSGGEIDTQAIRNYVHGEEEVDI